jgi:hypothetical protein
MWDVNVTRIFTLFVIANVMLILVRGFFWVAGGLTFLMNVQMKVFFSLIKPLLVATVVYLLYLKFY